jgi:hypothetical protein
VTPIPESAKPDDPKWAVSYLELVTGLVAAGARAKVIARLTGVSLPKISQLYRALRGTVPPPGPVMQGHARFFARPSKYTSEAWSVQSAIVLACYDRMGKVLEEPVQRGWQFLAAFHAYLTLTEKLHHTDSIKRLDINQAYALLTHSGFLSQTGAAELQRRECTTCLISYPVVTSEDLSPQTCPVCAINDNLVRLVWQSSPSRRRKQARPPK